MLRYLQGQYPNEEIVWGYLTEDGSALYQAVVDEQPNPDYLRVQNDLEDITREFDAYVRRLAGGAILSPQEAADMDDLEDTQYRLEKELEELRPIRAFVRMGDGTAAEAPAVMDEATPTDLAPLREPPAAPQVATHNFRFSEDYDLYPSGAKTKYKNNVMAIKLLKQIELEKRTATPEEQIILARYVGWGGLANAFSSTASGWENEYQELKSLLTDVEYKAAMNSTITAYYTEPDLIRHIYRALERFGFEGGPDRKILDPGMGTGNFYSVLPEQFQGSKLFGVELDSITGRIAKQLYPDADISIMGYEATKFEDNSFDVILGNIPFNSVKIYDRRYNDLNPYIHDYFFIKSLDLAKPGGIEKVQKLIADSLERTGLSPRYTRPDEKKKDIFPPKEKDENRVFAKDLMGNKHYYYRFYNENGIELYTMEKKREFFQTVYIPCDGFMVGIDQRHRLEEVLKWLPTLEHGIRGEIERVFNQSMEAPDRWADLGFANLLGRYEEAKAHNAPIAAERQRQADERRAQQEAREQQLTQERQARYDSAIREAEGNIMAGKEVINREINGKSLIMQLFREHEIPVPLKTQGWIINSLHSIRYDPQIGEWNYRYFKGSRNSTKMFDLLSKLSAAIQTRQQFEEHGASPPDTPVLDCEEEQDIKTIAAKCGYGVSTVKRALDELVKAGYIVKQARFDERKNGGQTSNLYTLCSDLLCPDKPENAPVLEDDASDESPAVQPESAPADACNASDPTPGEQSATLPTADSYSFADGFETKIGRQFCRPIRMWTGGQSIFIPP